MPNECLTALPTELAVSIRETFPSSDYVDSIRSHFTANNKFLKAKKGI